MQQGKCLNALIIYFQTAVYTKNQTLLTVEVVDSVEIPPNLLILFYIPSSPVYGVYMPQLIRYARESTNHSCFLSLKTIDVCVTDS